MPASHPTPRILGPLDWLVGILLIAGAAAALPVIQRSGPVLAIVYRDNQPIARFPLETATTFTVQGAEGPLTIAIENATVRIAQSTCGHGICVATGPISAPGRQIVCAPNRILVQLTTQGKGEPDAVAE